jgi:hypothetical protein
MSLLKLNIRSLITKLNESNLLGNYNDVLALVILLASILFVTGFVVLIYFSIKRRTNITVSYFLRIQIPGILKASANYFNHFGWIVLGILITLFLFFIWIPDYFHYILLVFVVGLFLLFPMKFIFSLVSGRNSLRALFLLFIVTQLLFSGIYFVQINKYREPGKAESEPECSINLHMEVAATLCVDKNIDEEISVENNNEGRKEEIEYSQILLNTFYIALIQECSPFLGDFIAEKEEFEELHNKFFLTLNIQIFISWLYLGVLIASLYQKISKR